MIIYDLVIFYLFKYFIGINLSIEQKKGAIKLQADGGV